MRHTISVLVENKFGVLARVAGMISGRGFNIDSLNVAPTHDASLSRITIVLNGDTAALDLCTKQLRKLVNVVEVMEFKDGQTVARELILVKVRADAKQRAEILQIKEIFRARIANLGPDSIIVELTGDEDKVSACLALLEPFGSSRSPAPGGLPSTSNAPKGKPTLPCPQKYTPTRTPTSACSGTRPSPFSDTAHRVTRTRSTSRTAGARS
jgi:acetolactate synthase-1/3 small subunit